jgi:hypothetical protein
MPNLEMHRAEVSEKLAAWISRNQERAPFVEFGQEDRKKYLLNAPDKVDSLPQALIIYTGMRRSSKKFLWRNIRFCALRDLPDYQGQSDVDLRRNSETLAASALAVFDELGFLYNLLFPADLGPARTGSGQNRALRTKQPEPACAWLTDEHCKGEIQASHIKPDCLGGLAVPGNLFWLCQFHHNLLDVYLRAEMRKDHSTRRIIASISSDPPPEKAGNGIPLSIWNQIGDKSKWPLPLKPESIGHLFD